MLDAIIHNDEPTQDDRLNRSQFAEAKEKHHWSCPVRLAQLVC